MAILWRPNVGQFLRARLSYFLAAKIISNTNKNIVSIFGNDLPTIKVAQVVGPEKY